MQVNSPVSAFLSMYSSNTTRSAAEKKHLHLVSGKERVLKVAGRKFFKMSLDVLAHIVSVIVGQRLPADSATEYSFFVSVNHRLDKGIHTWRKTFDQQHVEKIYYQACSIAPSDL